MAVWTSPLGASLAYLGFTLLAVVGPGIALQRLLCVRVDPALVLPLGFGCAAASYWLSLVTGHAWVFPASILLLDLPLVVARRRAWALAEGPSVVGALPALLAVVGLLGLTEYRQNRITSAGDFVVDGVVPEDTAFHVGLTWELALGYPPQVPGLSGFPMGYHLGQGLVRAAALRWAGVAPYDSLTRFDNTLAALALILALRAMVRALGGGTVAEALVPWSLFATDFSFLLAWDRGIDWWVSLFEGGTSLLSLLHANSVVPALTMALTTLVALRRYLAGEGLAWLALAGLSSACVPFFKVFVAAQLLLGLGAAVVFSRERRAAALVAAPAACATSYLVLATSGQTMQVLLAPLAVVRDTLTDIGVTPAGPFGLALWSVAWVVVSLGLRLLGVGAALRTLGSGAAPSVALAILGLSGWPLGVLFQVSPLESGARLRPFNEALYFFEQSGVLLWVFAATSLARWWPVGRRRVLALLLLMALSLPSTLQFIVHKIETPPRRIAAATVRAMSALAMEGRPGDVVLQRPEPQRYPPPPVVLIGRRVPYTRFIPFFAQFAAREQRLARFERVSEFFHTTDAEEARAIAREFGARYLCLYARDSVAFDGTGWIEPLFEEEGVRVYRMKP